MKKLILLLFLLPICFGQSNNQGAVSVTSPAPPSVSPNALRTNIVCGTHINCSGGNGIYFWLEVNYPIGSSSMTGPIFVNSPPNPLTVQNYINISWPSIPNATSYDLLAVVAAGKPPFPNPGATGTWGVAGCLSLTTSSCIYFTGLLSSYTVPTSVSQVTGHIVLNNLTYPSPNFLSDLPLNLCEVTGFEIDCPQATVWTMNTNPPTPPNAGIAMTQTSCTGTPGIGVSWLCPDGNTLSGWQIAGNGESLAPIEAMQTVTLSSQITETNNAENTLLQSGTFPANSFTAGTSFHYSLRGIQSDNGGAGTKTGNLTIKLYIGSAVVAQIQANNNTTTATTNAPFNFEGDVTINTTGIATTAVSTGGITLHQTQGTGAVAAFTAYALTYTNNSTTIDTTVNNVLSITAQQSIATTFTDVYQQARISVNRP